MPSKEFMKMLMRTLGLMVIWALFSTGMEFRYGLKTVDMHTWQYWVGSFFIVFSYSIIHTWVLNSVEKVKS